MNQMLSESENGFFDDTHERAKQIHIENDVILIHDHEPLADDLAACLKSNVTAKVMVPALDVDMGDIAGTKDVFKGWKSFCKERFDAVLDEIDQHQDKAMLVRSVADFETARSENKLGIILGVEGCKLLDGSLDSIKEWYDYGIRQMQLTWAYPNQLAGSSVTPEQGLTDLGFQAIKEMNEIGVLIDCTHASYKTFLDTLETSTKPIIISHSATKFVSDLKQKDWEGASWSFCSDDDMRRIRDNGGLLGLHLLAPFYHRTETGHSDISLADVLDHFEHAVSIIGIDYIALGGDYFPKYGKWYESQKAQNSLPIRYVVEKPELHRLTTALLTRGFNDTDIKKFLGLNYKRICSQVWK